MKRHVLFLLSALCAASAHAENAAVESALKNQPDLSAFTQALQTTGILAELQPHQRYTVFAPTNAAFAKLTPEEYPCLYAAECKPQIAAVLRNHIFLESLYLNDIARQRGAVMPSLNKNRYVDIGETGVQHFTIGGNNVVYEASIGINKGMLYKIDGLIAGPVELGTLQRLPAGTKTTTSQTRIYDPACGPQGCPDSATFETTIVTTPPAAPTGQ